VDFKCPICEKTTIPGLTSRVALNHDHKTGKITGYICDSCNTGLGRFKDDIVVLQRAIKYLESDK
jgi:RNase P subunit RPR2